MAEPSTSHSAGEQSLPAHDVPDDASTHIQLNPPPPSTSELQLPLTDSPLYDAPLVDESPGVIDPRQTVISKRPPISDSIPPQPANSMEMGIALEGEQLGHYKLEQFVGGGGMGAVFRAYDTMLDRTVAVKVLSRDRTDGEILRRFKNEAQSAARLDHENIARVHYVGESQGWNFIVFEFINGMNIRQLVAKKGPLPLEQAVNYTLQVAEALEHASRRDVVHRDIKPSNVLVTPDGRVKLVDMGLARLHQVESPEHDLTASGVTLGTFDYISPEQAKDPRSADVRSDLYSLGCTFYFMLTGRPPFPEGTVLQKLLSHTSEERPDVRSYRPEIPEAIVEVLDRMMAKQPSQRYQRPSELVGELLLMADQLGLHEASRGGTVWITPSQEPTGWLERLIPLVVPIVGLALTVLMLDRYWPQSGGQPAGRGAPALLRPAREVTLIPQPAANERLENDLGGQPPSDQAAPFELSPPASSPETSEPAPLSPGRAVVEAERDDRDDLSAPPATESIERLVESMVPAEGLGPPPQAYELGPVADATVSGILSAAQDALDGTTTSRAYAESGSSTLAALPVAPTRLIVGPQTRQVPTDAQRVASLQEACLRAAMMPDVDVVELWFDGPRVVEPFELPVASLTIRAGDNYAPEIVFLPKERGFTMNGRMVRLTGGDVTWKEIDFRIVLPAELADRWSLFHLDNIDHLRLDQCTLTVVNVDSNGGLLHEKVAFFELQKSPPLEMTVMDESITDPTVITLNRCVARGQATLVRADEVTPFVLTWQQGLFVSTQRLLETGGAIMEPAIRGKIKIELDHVTAIVQQGLCLMDSRPDAPHQLLLHVDLRNCIFSLDASTPLIEHRGLIGELTLDEKLDLHSRFSRFPLEALLWRIQPNDGQWITDFVHQKELKYEQNWFHEDVQSPLGASTWRQLPWDKKRVHRHAPEDYLLRQPWDNPDSSDFSGFDIEALPKMPEQIPFVSSGG